LYSGNISFRREFTSTILCVFSKSSGRLLAFSYRRALNTVPRRKTRPGGFRSLDSQACARHDAGVQVPATKTLGDILYADKSRIRVSEDEWLKLIQAIAGGDQGALHSLYEQTYRIVFTLMVRIIMNRETAEEVTLDVFYDVWRKASTYDPANGSVVGWIMNQARSRAIDRLRFDQRKKRVNTYPHDLRPTTDIVDPQQACLFEEQSRLLRDSLTALSTEERTAIEIAFFSELTYEQTASQLNQPLGTVKTRIRSGLGKLREALAVKGKATG
jgi:RNA polymerase sigma-70 factor (ECF subfamily)